MKTDPWGSGNTTNVEPVLGANLGVLVVSVVYELRSRSEDHQERR
jgi:hypothetical protein